MSRKVAQGGLVFPLVGQKPSSGFYAYLWLREDGTPYYVGKGCRMRAFNPSKHSCYPPKERIYVYPADSEQEALAFEKALIATFGRKDVGTGCLRNFTDGGETGPSGLKMSILSKQRMSDAHKGKAQTPQHVANRAAALRGKPRKTKGSQWSAARRAAGNPSRSVEYKNKMSFVKHQWWDAIRASRENNHGA